MKTLLLDIETLPTKAAVWGLYGVNISINQIIEPGQTVCAAMKWLGEPNKNTQFVSSWKDGFDPMVTALHSALDEADAVVTYNGCVVAGNRVLTQDLRWVDVASLVAGDKLLAFEEEPAGRNKPRKYCVSTVVHAEPIVKNCSEILLEDGRTIIASDDHPWLTYRYKNTNNLQYVPTEDLAGGVLVQCLPTWEEDTSREGGYIAAFFDGEGCLNQTRRKRATASEEYMLNCTFAQSTKDPSIIERLVGCLNAKQFAHSVVPYDKNHPDMRNIRVLGGLPEVLRLLGSTRPVKLGRLDYTKLSHAKLHANSVHKIVSVTPLGPREVIGLETTSKTYIVEGIPCHNTKFDLPTLNREFLLAGLTPPSPSKSIDLYRTVRKQFKFVSNKLDFVCQQLGLGSKTHHKGMDLWTGVEAGSKKDQRTMETYNKQDVFLLEKLYKRLLPWIPNHPSTVVHDGLTDVSRCPTCGGSHVQRRGYHITKVARYHRLHCQDCGSWSRERTVAEKASGTTLVGV